MSKYRKISVMLSGVSIPPAPLGHIYIYKITCKRTGKYYIGQTEAIKRRIYMHLYCIKNTILSKEYQTLPFHKELADCVRNGRFLAKSEVDAVVVGSLLIDILKVAENKSKAYEWEYGFLAPCVRDPRCLNKKFS